MLSRLVPDDFHVPQSCDFGRFRLYPLAPEHTALDYAAVLRCAEHIRSRYNITDPEDWPNSGMTYEEDLYDLRRHHEDFVDRTAFAYTVLSEDGSICLGCVYIDPPPLPEYQASITLWTDDDDTDLCLYRCLRGWISEVWPFDRVLWPTFDGGNGGSGSAWRAPTF